MRQTAKEKGNGAINQITEGVIWKQLLLFFFPIVAGTFFQQLYNTVDTLVVGRYVGTNALAAVGGSAAQFINLIVGFFTGLTAGATVTISQYYGARHDQALKESLHCAYAFSIIGSIVISIIGILLTPTMLRLMNTSPETLADATNYLRIYFCGILFVFIYNMGSAILRAVGDSKRPLYFLIICCVVNIVLDLLLVVVFQLGVIGVAAATLISQAVSAILVTRALMRSEGGLKLSLKDIRLYPAMLRNQLRIGLPGGLQSCMYNVSNVIIQASINSFGTSTTAASAAYIKLDAFYWMINNAFGIAITTFVGQNFGANKKDRIGRSIRDCFLMDCSVTILISVLIVSFAGPLFRFFTTDPEVIEIGRHMAQIVSPFYLAFVPIEILAGSLRGMSNVMVPTLLTLGGVCVLRLVWVFAAVPLNPSVATLYFSYPLTWTVTSILFFIYFAVVWRKYRAA